MCAIVQRYIMCLHILGHNLRQVHWFDMVTKVLWQCVLSSLISEQVLQVIRKCGLRGGVRMRITRVFLSILLACLVLTCAGFWLHDGEAPATAPSFATANQITHDGFAKTAVLSDGSALYVAEEKNGHQVISKIDPNSGEQTIVKTPFADVRALDVSPDHGSLLASPTRAGAKNRELWTILLNKVASARLGKLAADDAAWSPNGEELVSVRGHELWITSVKGANEKKLAEVAGKPFSPRFSPDGQRIRFSASDMETASSGLWEVNRDGSNLHELLPGWSMSKTFCCGVWSSDGKSYVFQATQSWPPITTLWVLAEGSAEPKQLTDGPMSFGSPWPADSEKIWALGVNPMAEVVKYDQEQKTYAPVLAGISATDLDFSADGKWITYVAIPDGTLWRSRADGSERVQLTFAPERAALPKWAPDGKQIAYVSIRAGQSTQIMLIGAEGGKAIAARAEKRGQIDTNWSADGQRLIFGYVVGAANLSISMLDMKAHKITTIPGSDGLFSPRWSPNGRYIAALSPDYTKVMLFDFQTQKWTTWFNDAAGSVSYPQWSSDSKSIYFDDMVTDEESIRRVKLGEDRAESVFVLRGIERYMGPYGFWVGQAPDGSWMFVRDRSTQEVYSLNLGLSK
jgi:Tol biopolymer transport system component